MLPEFVAEARKIILVPKEITREQIAIKRFRGDHLLDFSSDGNKLIMEDTIRKIYYLYDLNNLDSVFNINVNFQNLKTPTPGGVGVPTPTVLSGSRPECRLLLHHHCHGRGVYVFIVGFFQQFLCRVRMSYFFSLAY